MTGSRFCDFLRLFVAKQMQNYSTSTTQDKAELVPPVSVGFFGRDGLRAVSRTTAQNHRTSTTQDEAELVPPASVE
ncbi:Unannotated [Lentimonas sp. CC4]|nr:Unannotated [Lentimonas sp. CC4]CAA6683548.1 Unannotated [Lentimonas sp. CC6]CAA7077309.1 Unannotated [Lentimonas sp. CC4]CAA7170176.1 Unannotated [Lentimonas sp. CC21]CAA7182436.1 Unannotated [Lentimonas sp. CC8]